MDWGRPAKYHNMVHSEVNAINHSNPHLLKGSTLYVTGKPCDICMLAIAAKGIARVVYIDRSLSDPGSMMFKTEIFDKTDDIAHRGHVVLQAFRGRLDWMQEAISQLRQMDFIW
jgi:tRNA(Arg) A34 adenosine deaminase TadA